MNSNVSVIRVSENEFQFVSNKKRINVQNGEDRVLTLYIIIWTIFAAACTWNTNLVTRMCGIYFASCTMVCSLYVSYVRFPMQESIVYKHELIIIWICAYMVILSGGLYFLGALMYNPAFCWMPYFPVTIARKIVIFLDQKVFVRENK